MDRWTDVCTDSPCILQDIVPFGSAALKRRWEKKEASRDKEKSKEETERKQFQARVKCTERKQGGKIKEAR